MKSFYVINEDFNQKKMIPYDIMPYLIDCYNEIEKKPKTFDEFKKFIQSKGMYMWWSRCQYEIILSDWPNQSFQEKWDIYKQVVMNLDIITQILIDNINEENGKH